MIPGIFIYGRALLTGGPDEYETAISDDPVYLPRQFIEQGIASGALKAGIFSSVKVQPPVEEWPPEWRFLKELEWPSVISSIGRERQQSFRINWSRN